MVYGAQVHQLMEDYLSKERSTPIIHFAKSSRDKSLQHGS